MQARSASRRSAPCNAPGVLAVPKLAAGCWAPGAGARAPRAKGRPVPKDTRRKYTRRPRSAQQTLTAAPPQRTAATCSMSCSRLLSCAPKKDTLSTVALSIGKQHAHLAVRPTCHAELPAPSLERRQADADVLRSRTRWKARVQRRERLERHVFESASLCFRRSRCRQACEPRRAAVIPGCKARVQQWRVHATRRHNCRSALSECILGGLQASCVPCRFSSRLKVTWLRVLCLRWTASRSLRRVPCGVYAIHTLAYTLLRDARRALVLMLSLHVLLVVRTAVCDAVHRGPRKTHT